MITFAQNGPIKEFALCEEPYDDYLKCLSHIGLKTAPKESPNSCIGKHLIRAYTKYLFTNLNLALNLPTELFFCEKINNIMATFLAENRPYSEVVYSGQSYVPIFDTIQKDECVRVNNYLSSSKLTSVAQDFAKNLAAPSTVFQIRPITGVDISTYSHNIKEQEVLFAPYRILKFDHKIADWATFQMGSRPGEDKKPLKIIPKIFFIEVLNQAECNHMTDIKLFDLDP